MLSASIKFGSLVHLSELPEELRRLANSAIDVHTRSYCPYSKFAVGAALLHSDKAITTGVNYENCVYKGTCAEVCAICTANTLGRRTAEAVAVYGRSLLPEVTAAADSVTPPCGFCRQALIEVADISGNFDDFLVVLVSFSKEHARLMKLRDLAPMPFRPSDVGVDIVALANGDVAGMAQTKFAEAANAAT
ncbi:putative cytidine deaminase-like protein [Trypanosoma vivax]|uniref:Putative cytidine deaminase-like protein n=1 Tax=Trypanosoma vivax (strain Y486) TaxID=1055687 RepID=G0U1X3_TRYVY|nr:putative cytidine deaminase-like protein [Trypanosoma vivax]CCC50273.1 putative cytidine deaminase-like protein [Trypanosoma vivax Y486]